MTGAKRIEQLMDELGAEFAITLKKFPTYRIKELVLKRAKVELLYEDIEGSITLPEWPKYKNDEQKPAKLTVIWDRPVPWSAGHRQFLRRVLAGPQFHDDDLAHLWASPVNDQTAPPLENHVAMMRPLTMAALDAANCRYVLLLGAVATKMWRRELQLQQVEGHSAIWNERYIVFPLANPLTVMRDPMLQGEFREDLFRFCAMINDGQEFDLLARKCATKKCDEGVFMYDEDGVPWCNRHYVKGMNAKIKHHGIAQTKMNLENHPRML